MLQKFQMHIIKEFFNEFPLQFHMSYENSHAINFKWIYAKSALFSFHHFNDILKLSEGNA